MGTKESLKARSLRRRPPGVSAHLCQVPGAKVGAFPRCVLPVNRKNADGPASGHNPAIGIRLPKVLMRSVLQWSAANRPSCTEAIRRLV